MEGESSVFTWALRDYSNYLLLSVLFVRIECFVCFKLCSKLVWKNSRKQLVEPMMPLIKLKIWPQIRFAHNMCFKGIDKESLLAFSDFFVGMLVFSQLDMWASFIWYRDSRYSGSVYMHQRKIIVKTTNADDSLVMIYMHL
jgi:hypothetical protein